jgi:hypothetical protein
MIGFVSSVHSTNSCFYHEWCEFTDSTKVDVVDGCHHNIRETFYYFLGTLDCLMYAQLPECGTIDLKSYLHR